MEVTHTAIKKDAGKIPKEKQMDNLIKSLERVNPDTKKMVFGISQSLPEVELIKAFNQQSTDLFIALSAISKKMGKEKLFNVAGYHALFSSAVKINHKIPIDKYTLAILEFAADIYDDNEEKLLNIPVADEVHIKVGNEFGLIRTAQFKELWGVLSAVDKQLIKSSLTLLTTYAHAYLYHTLSKNASK